MAKSQHSILLALCAGLAFIGCSDGSSGGGGDASTPSADAGGTADAGAADAGGADADVARPDAAPLADGAAPDGAAPDAATPCDTSRAPVLPQLDLEAVLPSNAGLKRIVYASQAPGSDDWYLVLQTGTIRVLSGGVLAPAPFLDVSSETQVVKDSDERGLLGLAFPPDFATSQLFYVMVTPYSATQQTGDEVREYKVVNGKGELQRTLLALPASAANHNGGTIVFGPDGFLYVGTGDGGGGCNDNKPGTPQDPRSPFGKIHRLDPKAPAPHGAAGNPYPEAPTVLHIGLRNPFRFNVDPTSRSLIIGDVGQDSYEELDIVGLDAPGKNFGWAAFEGEKSTCGRNLGSQADWERPVFVADRRGNGQCAAGTKFCDWKSVIGGQLYGGTQVAGLKDILLFGDYVGRRMVAMTYCNGKASPATLINKACDPNDPNEACFLTQQLTSLTAIVRDHQGEIYLVADGSQLWRIVPAANPGP